MRISTTIPDAMYKIIKENYKRIGYTSVNDFILDCIRQSGLYQSSPMHQIGVKEIPVELISTGRTVMRNVTFNKVGEVIKKVSKSEFCPHMISTDGYCRKCEG